MQNVVLHLLRASLQWHNRRGRAECPQDFWLGNFCWPIGKNEARKKGERGENWEEKKENCKMEGGKLEMEVGKVIKKRWGPFFFHFLKWWEFVLGLPKWEFSNRKKHFTLGKNQEKWLCPLRKICLLCPCFTVLRLLRNHDDVNPEVR